MMDEPMGTQEYSKPMTRQEALKLYLAIVRARAFVYDQPESQTKDITYKHLNVALATVKTSLGFKNAND